MIINIDQIKSLLDNENISTNQIQKITGFNRKNVWMYRTGNTHLMQMKLQTAIKLQECYDLTHDNLMKYKNFESVIDSFNGRYGQTEIFINPDTNELKIVYDGILGDVSEGDIKIVDKKATRTIDSDKLLLFLKNKNA